MFFGQNIQKNEWNVRKIIVHYFFLKNGLLQNNKYCKIIYI